MKALIAILAMFAFVSVNAFSQTAVPVAKEKAKTELKKDVKKAHKHGKKAHKHHKKEVKAIKK